MPSKTLIINAHPKVDDPASYSIQMLNRFKALYMSLMPDALLEQIDLYDNDIPVVDRTVLSAWDKLDKGGKPNDDERPVIERMKLILEQFKSAHTYVIVLPLHNFNVPSKLKDYMDNVLIAKETFRYLPGGTSEGLLNDGRRLLILQASGGFYTNNDWYSDVEFSYKYLSAMFSFIGVKDIDIVRAEGTTRSVGVAEAMDQCYSEIDQATRRFASTVPS
ncbi:NAD(P)H dehydrogenase [Hesseltinella vesiculosa]|uniref:FMN-dependent NADH-azoreductase n=1 Tax=Hesseltinella vesiculosa TaxID=101127 RepID=A0A1X2GCI4_9FUNG|nr:NAD(P)H dehydrogenase [Hesseltinella vesiculosa]